MPSTRRHVWFMAGLGLTVALIQFALAHDHLGPRLWVGDWILLALLLAAPPVALWRYFRRVRETTRDVLYTGVQLVMSGYVPLWFGFMMVRRVMQGN